MHNLGDTQFSRQFPFVLFIAPIFPYFLSQLKEELVLFSLRSKLLRSHKQKKKSNDDDNVMIYVDYE